MSRIVNCASKSAKIRGFVLGGHHVRNSRHPTAIVHGADAGRTFACHPQLRCIDPDAASPTVSCDRVVCVRSSLRAGRPLLIALHSAISPRGSTEISRSILSSARSFVSGEQWDSPNISQHTLFCGVALPGVPPDGIVLKARLPRKPGYPQIAAKL